MSTLTRDRLTSPFLLAGAAVWMASLALYLATLAPTLSWGHDDLGVDGGELLAAASTLGIPPPTRLPDVYAALEGIREPRPSG